MHACVASLKCTFFIFSNNVNDFNFEHFLAFVKILPPKMEPSKLASVEIKFHSGFSCGSEDVLLGVKSKNISQPCVFKIGDFERGSIITQCQLLINGQEENLPEIAIYSKSKDKFCLQHVKVRNQNDVDSDASSRIFRISSVGQHWIKVVSVHVIIFRYIN